MLVACVIHIVAYFEKFEMVLNSEIRLIFWCDLALWDSGVQPQFPSGHSRAVTQTIVLHLPKN